jgi:hypothetical protein
VIRAVPAVAVTCEHRDDHGTQCPAQLMLRATDPGDIPLDDVRTAALLRGWAVDGTERCPTHRGVPA